MRKPVWTAYRNTFQSDCYNGNHGWAKIIFFYEEKSVEKFFEEKEDYTTKHGIPLKKDWTYKNLNALDASLIIDDIGLF